MKGLRNFLINLTFAFALQQVSSLAAADGDRGRIGKGAETLPLFDAHMHYKREAWRPFPPDVVLSMMDANGVAMALVSSTPDEGTIMLWKYAPGRFVPEMRPYTGSFGSSNWTKWKEVDPAN